VDLHFIINPHPTIRQHQEASSQSKHLPNIEWNLIGHLLHPDMMKVTCVFTPGRRYESISGRHVRCPSAQCMLVRALWHSLSLQSGRKKKWNYMLLNEKAKEDKEKQEETR